MRALNWLIPVLVVGFIIGCQKDLYAASAHRHLPDSINQVPQGAMTSGQYQSPKEPSKKRPIVQVSDAGVGNPGVNDSSTGALNGSVTGEAAATAGSPGSTSQTGNDLKPAGVDAGRPSKR